MSKQVTGVFAPRRPQSLKSHSRHGGWGVAGTPTKISPLSFAKIQVTHHFVFLVIQTGSLFQRPYSLAGLLNRDILTFQKKAKVNIGKSFFWSAIRIAPIYPTFPRAKHPTWCFMYDSDFILPSLGGRSLLPFYR